MLLAPDYEPAALEALQRKQDVRILADRERRGFDAAERDYKRVVGGLLVQDRDFDVDDREGWRSWPVTRPKSAGATCSSRGGSAST